MLDVGVDFLNVTFRKSNAAFRKSTPTMSLHGFGEPENERVRYNSFPFAADLNKHTGNRFIKSRSI